MEQSPSWEANCFAAGQEIPRILWDPEGSLPLSQVSITWPYTEPAESSPYSHLPFPEDQYEYYPPIYLPLCKIAYSIQYSNMLYRFLA
jgi:hypothetical protein